jgi:hypothetical protein
VPAIHRRLLDICQPLDGAPGDRRGPGQAQGPPRDANRVTALGDPS